MQLSGILFKSEDFNHALQDHNDPVASQSDELYGCTKVQEDRRSLLEVVPDDYFVRLVQRTNATPDQGQVVASEQHLHVAQTTLREGVTFLEGGAG